MRVAVLGDGHFGVRSGDPQFLDFQIKWWQKKIRAIAAAGIKIIVQVGDLFDNRKSMDSRVAWRFLHEVAPLLEEFDLKMIITLGNHNIYFRDDNSIHNMFFLLNNPRIEIISEQKTIGNCLFLGWINKNNEAAMLKAVADSSAEYCFAHLEPDGMLMSKGVAAKHGMDMKPFRKFKKVYTGHYHTVSIDGNIQMVGSPYHITWSDVPDGTDRGWFEIDTDAHTEVFHRNDSTDSLFVVEEHDPTKTYSDGSLSHLAGRIVRMVVTDKGDTRSFNKFLSLLSAAKTIEYRVIDNTIAPDKTAPEKVDPNRIVSNVGEFFVNYTRQLAATVPGADPEVAANLAQTLYQEAQTNGNKA